MAALKSIIESRQKELLGKIVTRELNTISLLAQRRKNPDNTRNLVR